MKLLEESATGRSSSDSLDAEAFLLSILRGRSGFWPALIRLLLATLAPVYCTGLKLYLLPYRIGIRRQFRLPCPVIVVGNLTTGGTGKTPLTQTLCRMLQASGVRVVILNRGYGGRHEYGCAVVSDETTVYMEALEAGDEAVLLARTLPGIPVIVGKDRRKTGSLAWERFRPHVIVLDDGLQFWQLHRDLNIVLLNAAEPFDNGWTFPRGLLREPPSHLRRAGLIVLTNANHVEHAPLQALKRRVEQLAPGRPICTSALVAADLREIGAESIQPTSWLQARSVTAMSALGNPESFEKTLAELGAKVVERFRFRDHQPISEADLENVLARSRNSESTAIITTEKDAVKLKSSGTTPPIFSLRVSMRIDQESLFLETVRGVIRPPKPTV